VGFLADGLLAAGFFSAGFLAAGFLAAGFLAAGFLAAGFLAAGFLVEGFFATGLAVGMGISINMICKKLAEVYLYSNLISIPFLISKWNTPRPRVIMRLSNMKAVSNGREKGGVIPGP
jgi:hypothetical protein